MLSVGDDKSATHGTTDVLDGTSVTYRPNPGYIGTDSFEYTIVDPFGKTDVGTVNVELFDPNSPNRPPITRPDTIRTWVNRPVTIDVLANDIDPERDMLTVSDVPDRPRRQDHRRPRPDEAAGAGVHPTPR